MLTKHVQQLVKPILKFSILKLKSLFISCEFNIPGFIGFYAFLHQLNNLVSSGYRYPPFRDNWPPV